MAYTSADPYVVLADATAMLDEVYDMDPLVQQNRFGTTAQHITRETIWKGGALHKKFLTQIYTGARMNSDLEADAPNATKIGTTDITIEEEHLRLIQLPLSYSLPAQSEVDGSDDAVWNLANELVAQAQQMLGEKRNQMLNSNSDCLKATVSAKYKNDGDTYPGSSATTCLIKLTGSPSMFHEGELVDIRAASDNDNTRVTATVKDVIHDTHIFGRNVGPAIVLEYLSTGSGAGATTNFDSTTAGDEIVASGEKGYGWTGAFDALCDLTSSPPAYFGVTRTTVGNRYLIPYGQDYTSGTAVDLDIDTHFGNMADALGYLMEKSRIWRQSNQKFKLTDALVCQAAPELANEIDRQIGEGTASFTRTIASSLDAARRADLVAVSGWTGSVLLSSSMPPIVVQAEPLCPANTIRFFEPNAWEFIRMGGKKPNFIKAPGANSIWHNRRNVTTGNLTQLLDACGSVVEAPFCDQPRLNYTIKGVKSSLR
jgi:hypothetical protein